MNPERVDLSVLEEYVGHAPNTLRAFVALAIQSLQQALAPLAEGMARSDLALLGECGHRAKSTALHVGAQTFAHACMALATAARQGRLPEALALAAEVQARRAAVEDALHAALRERLGDAPRDAEG